MILEHLVYSIAIAIAFGMIYRRITGRKSSWIIVLSAYAPDVDIIADQFWGRLELQFWFCASIAKDFHNLGVLLVYAVAVSFLLYLGIRFVDSFIFASVGFAAHLFEDALVFSQGYRMLWPLSLQKFRIGVSKYKADLYGVADKEVLVIGLILVGICAVVRTMYEELDKEKRKFKKWQISGIWVVLESISLRNFIPFLLILQK